MSYWPCFGYCFQIPNPLSRCFAHESGIVVIYSSTFCLVPCPWSPTPRADPRAGCGRLPFSQPFTPSVFLVCPTAPPPTWWVFSPSPLSVTPTIHCLSTNPIFPPFNIPHSFPHRDGWVSYSACYILRILTALQFWCADSCRRNLDNTWKHRYIFSINSFSRIFGYCF